MFLDFFSQFHLVQQLGTHAFSLVFLVENVKTGNKNVSKFIYLTPRTASLKEVERYYWSYKGLLISSLWRIIFSYITGQRILIFPLLYSSQPESLEDVVIYMEQLLQVRICYFCSHLQAVTILHSHRIMHRSQRVTTTSLMLFICSDRSKSMSFVIEKALRPRVGLPSHFVVPWVFTFLVGVWGRLKSH